MNDAAPRRRWPALLVCFVLILTPTLLLGPIPAEPSVGSQRELPLLSGVLRERWADRLHELNVRTVTTECPERSGHVCYVARDRGGHPLGATMEARYPYPSAEGFSPTPLVLYFDRRPAGLLVRSNLRQDLIAPDEAVRHLEGVMEHLTAAVARRRDNQRAWEGVPPGACVRPADSAPAPETHAPPWMPAPMTPDDPPASAIRGQSPLRPRA